MEQKKQKQFSLSILMRVFLAVIVVVSLVVFANSVMRYNQLMEEEEKLAEIVNDLKVIKEELLITAESAEQLSAILSDYDEYKKMLNSGTELGAQLGELEMKRAELEALINKSENKEYIVRIAKEKLGLYFPNEEIFYSGTN